MNLKAHEPDFLSCRYFYAIFKVESKELELELRHTNLKDPTLLRVE